MNHEHHNFLYTFIRTWASIPCSTWGLCSSWPCPRVRLSPLLAHTYLASNLFVLAQPAACCLSQWFIFHMCNPPLTTRWFNTFLQVSTMGAQYNIYNRHIHSLQHFFSCLLLTSGQVGWPRIFMSGTDMTWHNTVYTSKLRITHFFTFDYKLYKN
jgi:hypothetical protein